MKNQILLSHGIYYSLKLDRKEISIHTGTPGDGRRVGQAIPTLCPVVSMAAKSIVV